MAWLNVSVSMDPKIETLIIALARKLLDSPNGINEEQYEALHDLMENCTSFEAQNLMDTVDATDGCFYIKSDD
jgi:hypothetical protein